MTTTQANYCPLEAAYAKLGGKGTWAAQCPLPEEPTTEDLVEILRATEGFVDSVKLALKVFEDDASNLRGVILAEMLGGNTKSLTTAASGTRVSVAAAERASVDPERWAEVYEYIRSNNRFDLLSKTIASRKVIDAMRGDTSLGIEPEFIPGVSIVKVHTLTVTKKKA